MAVQSWIGSVWSLRGERGPVIGRVAEVEGHFVTLAVVGMEGQSPDGVEVLPSDGAGFQRARVPTTSLLSRWKRMGGEAS